MRTVTLLIGLFFTSNIFAQEQVKAEKLENNNGYFTIKESGKPFTGEIVYYFENGNIDAIYQCTKGKKQGKIQLFYDSGVKSGELFSNAKHENFGTITSWNEDGSIAFEGYFKSNVLYKKGQKAPFTGSYSTFYKNGQLSFKGNFKDGKWDGAPELYLRDGTLKTSFGQETAEK